MSLYWMCKLASLVRQIQIENPRGSKKFFGEDYPIREMTYPVDYGFLPDHFGEDEAELDFFVGTNANNGGSGSFRVWRPDVKGKRETKFYVNTSPEERAAILAAFNTVIRGNPVNYVTPQHLLRAIRRFKTRQ